MEIKIKLLKSERYKDEDTFDAAIIRWVEKGWRFATIAQDFKTNDDDAVAILWRLKE